MANVACRKARQPDSQKKGETMLYLVPTPIGNLGDMTIRALEVLKEVDWIYAEDTRRTRALLTHFEIGAKLRSYHEHNKKQVEDQVVDILKQNGKVALVSDAGMPIVSDPGLELVERCVSENLEYTVLPGATAFATAYAGSGLGEREFCFVGFLPKSRKNKRAKLREIAADTRLHIFYEAPHALLETLSEMLEALGDRRAVIARELTKVHEEYLRGSLSELISTFEATEPRGEFVILVTGAAKSEQDKTEGIAPKDALAAGFIEGQMSAGISAKSAAAAAAERFGIKKKNAYDIAVGIKEGKSKS